VYRHHGYPVQSYAIVYACVDCNEVMASLGSPFCFDSDLLTGRRLDGRIPVQMTKNAKIRGPKEKREALLKLPEAALELRISFPTIKQWIYKHKIRSVKTVGGHHRIPQSEVDRLLYRTWGKNSPEQTHVERRVSGRNQLVGRIDGVRVSGLMAEVKLSIGDQQITSIITASSARDMHLKPGQTAAALIKAEVMILRV
jgi:molybdopterin-binding protein